MLKNYKTLTDLWHKTAMHMLFATSDEIDWVSNADTMVYDNQLRCSSMEFDFDAGRDLWLTKSRFTVLQRDYLDLYSLDQFLDRCESIGLGESKRGVVTTMPARQHTMSAKKYRWGNCMLAWSYRGGTKAEQPTLTMHSRVSYIAYIGGLDLALCYVLAREIGNRIGRPPEDFAFRWQIDSLQFHGFKSIPYLFRHELEDVLASDTREYPSSSHPTLKLVRRWYADIIKKYEAGKSLEAEKYGPLKRIRRRHLQYVTEDFMDPVPLESLTLNPLRGIR